MSEPVHGLPGLKSASTASYRGVFRSIDAVRYLPGGAVIDGAKARDLGHGDDPDVLRAGTLLGKVAATGRYAASVIGTLGADYTTGTTMTVSAAVAAELVRRIGTSGTFIVTGPPSEAGTVASDTITYSNVNTATGAVTITASSVDFIAGSLVQPTDGSQTPITFVPDGYGIKVTDASGANVLTPMPHVPVAGTIDSSQLLPWPADASLRTQIKTWLGNAGSFVFDDAF
jgi:hypothetical protein